MLLLVAARLLLVALVAAGVSGHFLRPRAWDELAGGINQGLGTVPNVRVPYHGVDEWTRIVITLGGTMLVALGRCGLRPPARWGARLSARRGRPAGHARLVAIMQRDTAHQFWGGAAFTLLLVALFWLERVQPVHRHRGAGGRARRDGDPRRARAQQGLDRDTALLDYENLAPSLSAGASRAWSWNHDYAPLDARAGSEGAARAGAPPRVLEGHGPAGVRTAATRVQGGGLPELGHG